MKILEAPSILTVLFEGDMKNPELLKRMDQYETELEKDTMVGSVNSLASMIRIMSRSLNNENDKLYDKIPDSRNAVAQYLELYNMSGDPEDFEGLVNFDYTQALMIVQFRADTKNALDDVISKIDLMTKHDPNRTLLGGYCLVDKELSEAVVNGQCNSLIFAIAIIAFLLILIFRSLNSGWLGSLPLIYTIIALFGTMGWVGIKLDIATAMLSSIAIGIGIDYTIHFFWRYKQELQLGASYEEAITNTLNYRPGYRYQCFFSYYGICNPIHLISSNYQILRFSDYILRSALLALRAYFNSITLPVDQTNFFRIKSS